MDNIKKLSLTENGFIINYLISGPRLTEFVDDKVDSNQLRYEKYLRSIVAEKCDKMPGEEIELGAISDIGMQWKYYYSPGNWFVDVSDFYSLLKKIDLLAAVNLCVEEDMEVPAYLWTYAAVDIWLNTEHICSVDTPVYKPITRKNMMLKLKKGENLIYIKMQNLGVRDTRNIFGIQLLENIDKIKISLPDSGKVEPFVRLAKWLSNIQLDGHTLKLNEEANCDVYLIYDSRNIDLTKAGERFEEINITGKTSVELKPGEAYIIVQGIINGQKLTRRIELVEEVKPQYVKEVVSYKENMELIYNRIAEVVQMDRGEDEGFSMYNILARKHLNKDLGAVDEELFYETLSQIHNRIDCSDFLMAGLLRYIKKYPMEEKLYAKAKDVILNYRYWMDQKGSDGMCFWSENHALMFYSCAMIAGEMYPGDYFTRAERNGKELFQYGRDKVIQWLSDLELDGYEEFLSAGYMCVTFAALLNVVDFGDEELSKRASSLLDILLEQLSLHTFKGSVIAPQGRVYRDVIYPYTQGVQALINIIDPSAPYSLSEWLIFMATSKYEVPEGLIKLMNSPVNKEYSTGNALIKLNKTKEFIMTSVQSPREDKEPHMWDNISLNEDSDTTTYLYVKSMNERFHGTTRFEPGVYGYQQHMWCAAIDIDNVVFVNHPGGTFDGSSMRPGYWYGNGIMPAVKQENNIIGCVYVIPDNYPIHFTHLHWKNVMFDKVEQSGKWLFGKKKESYIGVWCSESMQQIDDQMFNVEYRAYADETAYVCYCSNEGEVGSFEEFMIQCGAINPYFDKNTLTLTTVNGFSLHYEKYENLTQFI
jgi:hypothetical protein